MIYNIINFNAYRNYIVYFLFDASELVYVGRTTMDLRFRISNHRNDGKTFDEVYYIQTDRDNFSLLENHYIKLYKPKFNNAIYHTDKIKYKKRKKYCKLWNCIGIQYVEQSKLTNRRRRIDSNGNIFTVSKYPTLWDGIIVHGKRNKIMISEFPYYKKLEYVGAYPDEDRRKILGRIYYNKLRLKINKPIKPTYCKLWDGVNRYCQNHDILIRDIWPEKAKIATYARRNKKMFGNSYKQHKDSNISRERVSMNISSKQLGRMFGWGNSKMSRVERGDLRLNWEDKIIVSRFMNKPIDYLFNNEPVMLDKLWYGMNNSNWTNGYHGYYKYRKHA